MENLKQQQVIIKPEHHEYFYDWCYSQHGQHEDCVVADTLYDWKNNNATIDEVVDALDDSDDGWNESWETFLNNRTIK